MSLLSRVPAALHGKVNSYWQSWLSACDQKNIDSHPVVDLALLGYVFACSEFVATNMCRYPQRWHESVADGLLQKSLSLDDYQQTLSAKLAAVTPLTDVLLMQILRFTENSCRVE